MSTSPSQSGSVVWSLLVIVGLVVALIVGIFSGPWLRTSTQHLFGGTSAQKPAATGTWYISQMHPWIISPVPGTCPICGADLVPVDPARFASAITIDPVVVQNMGVRTAVVEQAAVIRSVRTVGTVTIDETLVSDVNLKIAGWVDHMQVDSLWAPVELGATLFDVYAPELYTAQQEYLLARANADSPRGAEMLAVARTKLHFLDIGDAAIAALDQSGVPARTMSITAPRSGVLAMKSVNTGTYVMPGMTSMRIADLSRVWIEAVIYEHQLDPTLIHQGQAASVTPALSAAEPITATIDYVYPTIDPRLREVRVRLVVDNSAGLLKPGMFTTVTISEIQPPALLVPREAVVGTGERHVAFVSKGRGTFEPRTLRIGRATDDGRVPVLAGLVAGERVVTSGQFLLDSESRMREGLAKVMNAGLSALPTEKPAEAQEDALPDVAAAALPALLDAYLAVQRPLAEGKLEPAMAATKPLLAATTAFSTAGLQATPHFLHRFTEVERLLALAQSLSTAHELTTERVVFSNFSVDLITLAERTGLPTAYAGTLRAFTCGMFKAAPLGGMWIQEGTVPHNPFFGGTAMADCKTSDKPFAAFAKQPVPVPVTDPHADHQ